MIAKRRIEDKTAAECQTRREQCDKMFFDDGGQSALFHSPTGLEVTPLASPVSDQVRKLLGKRGKYRDFR